MKTEWLSMNLKECIQKLDYEVYFIGLFMALCLIITKYKVNTFCKHLADDYKLASILT